MVAALATMESMTSEQLGIPVPCPGDCGSAQARARTHVQAYVQTQARQNGSSKDGSANGPSRMIRGAVRPGGNMACSGARDAASGVASRALLPWLMSIIGIASACMVIAWFPSTV